MGAAAAIEATEPVEGAGGKGGRKTLVLIAAPVVLAALAAGLWFGGVAPRLLGMSAAPARADGRTEAKPAAPIYLEVPEIVANLNGNPRHPSYIKVKPRMELARQEDVAIVQAAMPRVLDMFQTFLRETRPEELRGAVGIHRLREELIARANIAAAPARVVDVLFAEMLVQ